MADYTYPWLTGTPASKLATSHIHPLVASARGYETLTPTNYTDWLDRYNIGRRNSKNAIFVRDIINTQDAMFIPWYSTQSVTQARLHNITPALDTWQLRPATPRYLNGTSKPAKYVSAPGAPTILDLHPSTPTNALSHDTVIITEGVLKADAITSLQLAHHHPHSLPPVSGRLIEDQTSLATLIQQTPDWIPVIAIAGVYNWRNNPEWASLNLRNKNVLVAFDADTATNPQVWAAASSLFQFLETSKKAASIQLINIPSTPDDQHRGIDDWIHDGATLPQVLESTSDLPPRPVDGPAEPGIMRISTDGLRLEASSEAGWIPVSNVGGRIVSFTNPRFPTDQEIRTGHLNAGLPLDQQTENNADAIVRIDVSWLDEDNHPQTVTVEGPSAILSHDPKDWDRWGARLPPALYACPDWPPNKGLEWLAAVRQNRKTEIQYIDRWLSMGWIPRENLPPVFSIGPQVIDSDGAITLTNHTPLREEDLAGASLFGCIPPKHPAGSREFKQRVIECFTQIYEAFFCSGAWSDPTIPILVLALALRPIAPPPTRLASFFVGTKGSGKSWTAATIMGFWQHTPGTWSNSRLPGGATDTAASMEHALARTPIWVADDLAPSTSRMRAESMESGMGEIIRSVHDHRGRRRMNPDGTARIVNTPRALLVVTGENEFTNQSVADRTLIVRFGKDSLAAKKPDGSENPDALRKVTALMDKTPVLSEFTGLCIAMICECAKEHGWEKTYEMFEGFSTGGLSQYKTMFKDAVSGSGGLGTRKLEMVRELFMGLYVLEVVLFNAGAADDLTLGPVLWEGLCGPKGYEARWYKALFEFVLGDVEEAAGFSPGASLVEGLRSVLASGKAHVVNAGGDPGEAPLGEPGADTALGWVFDTGRQVWTPRGETIGWLIQRDTQRGVLFDCRAAFNLVQRWFPDLLPPGTKQAATWGAVWAEGLAVDWFKREVNNTGGRRNNVQATVAEGVIRRGVPVGLGVLLGTSGDAAGGDGVVF